MDDWMSNFWIIEFPSIGGVDSDEVGRRGGRERRILRQKNNKQIINSHAQKGQNKTERKNLFFLAV